MRFSRVSCMKQQQQKQQQQLVRALGHRAAASSSGNDLSNKIEEAPSPKRNAAVTDRNTCMHMRAGISDIGIQRTPRVTIGPPIALYSVAGHHFNIIITLLISSLHL